MNRLDDLLQFHHQALSLRGQRQQLIASNIANADTPHYKARDFDFNAALQSALTHDRPAAALATTAPGHVAARPGEAGPAGVPLLYRTQTQGAVDGNSVDVDAERAAFADNAVHYEANLTFLNHQIKAMLAAIQG
jgi:flagellar basal-body rod protein FlgB